MTYIANFQHADDIISHLNVVIPGIKDPLLVTKYVGFVSISAVTVYETAIKEIFINFAKSKHNVLGTFTESFFEKINGRIRIENVRNDYIKCFGAKYLLKFDKKIASTVELHLHSHGRDIKNSYANLITWRNDFTHSGIIKTSSTYKEVIQAYQDGKKVIHCLAETMIR